MPNQDPKVTAQLRRLLEPVPALKDRCDDLMHRDPAPGSAGTIDRAGILGKHIMEFAGQSLAAASDHLVIWDRLLHAGIQPERAHITLVRGVAESVVLVRWLIDPRVPSAERIRRGVAAQIDDQDERRKFEADSGADKIDAPPPYKSGGRRLANLKEARDKAKIPALEVPSTTDLFRDFGAPGYRDHRWIYRLASGFAHGRPWTLLMTNIEALSVAADDHGTRRAMITANDTLSVSMTAWAVSYFGTALDEFATYLGIGPERALSGFLTAGFIESGHHTA